ncbi:MAG: S41 family peptidase [Coriobacteriales bacterium]
MRRPAQRADGGREERPEACTDDTSESLAAPRDRNARSRGRRARAALAISAGAVAVLAAGFALGAAFGGTLPGSAGASRDDSQASEDQGTLDDGYGGTLARRVAAVASDVVANAAQVPSLDEITDGALSGVVSATGADARYLTQGEFEAYQAAVRDAAQGVRMDLSDEGGSSVGYVAVGAFATGVADRVSEAVSELADAGAEAFVLDLRGAEGGDLSQAVQVASLFLNGGTVTVETTADGELRQEAQPSLHQSDAPLVVLVSHDTTGVAEVVAGALQDHRRALVVGDLTAGSGEALTLRTLSFGGAVLYVSGTCETPDGYAIAGRGIAPDLIVPMDPSLRGADLGAAAGSAAPDPADASASSGGDDAASSADAPAAGSGSSDTAQGGSAGSDARDSSGGAGADEAATDAQMAAAVRAARAWLAAGDIDVDGLSNDPGPQDAAIDEAQERLDGLGAIDWAAVRTSSPGSASKTGSQAEDGTGVAGSSGGASSGSAYADQEGR